MTKQASLPTTVSRMPKPRIYLAGPDVFFENPVAAGDAKKLICARAGLDGAFPLDNEFKLSSMSRQAAGLMIGSANLGLMNSCDAVIANLQPWHGPSADAGTVFEVGYMLGRGKPVFAYTNTEDLFEARVQAFLKSDYGIAYQPGNSEINEPGRPIYTNEEFQLTDNLMIDTAVFAFGRKIHISFEDAVTDAAAWFHARS